MEPKQPERQPNSGARSAPRRPAHRTNATNRYSGVHPSARTHTTGGVSPRPQGDSGRSAQKKARTKTFQYGGKFGRSKRPEMTQSSRATVIRDEKSKSTIPSAGENIRVIPLGGVEEIGRNMTLVEYKDDIVIIDMGFQLKTEETPGIDYIIPNTKYLEERKDKIRGVIITHGHLDHIGGIPYIIDRIGYPKMYSRFLTTVMIKKRQEEFPHLKPLDIVTIEKDETITLGNLKIRFFGVTHTIPDAMGVIIETPYGNIVTPGDFKLEHMNEVVSEREEKEYAAFEKMNTLMLLGESTNIENPGFSTPEKLVHEGLEKIITEIKSRLVIGTFASQMERIEHIVQVCEKLGKKVVVEGRSMKNNIEILKFVGRLKTKKETFIDASEIDNFPESKIVVLATGAQGDEFAALMRMSNKTHKNIKLHEGDTILLSSSIIPGNEKAVEKLKDNLARQGCKIIHYRTSEVYVHSTGHANKGEIEWLHKKIKPKFFMPLHGNLYRLKLHADLAESLGMPKDHIVVPENGTIIEISEGGTKIAALKERAPHFPVMIDGFSIGDVQDVVIRDRQMLAQDGMFVVIATVDQETGTLKKSPDLISRGFIYLKENQELLRSARHIIKKTVEDGMRGQNPVNFDYIKAQLGDNISKFLFQKTAKRPLVIPVVLSV